MLRANWRPLLFIFPDHVPIPGRQRENRENGHSDQRAEGDLQAGQLSVLLIPLFSLINYSTLVSHRNTVISHAVMASKIVTRSSLLQCATVSEGVIHCPWQILKDIFLYADLGNLSRKDLVHRIVITDMKCINDQGKANSFFVNLIPCGIWWADRCM